jgi:glycosyltransferase involved in cell wall biosynthesis
MSAPQIQSGLRIAWLNQWDPMNPLGGGVEREIGELGRRFAARGHDLTVVSENDHGMPADSTLDGYHIIRPRSRIGIHLWAMLTITNKRTGSGYDVVIHDLAKIVPWTLQWTKNRPPSIVCVHHIFGRSLADEMPGPAGGLMVMAEQIIPRLHRDFTYVTEANYTKSLLVKMDVPPDRIQVIRPGLNTAFFQPDPAVRSPTPLLTYSGRIKRYKRLDLALEALSLLLTSYPETRLRIIGSGTDVERLKGLARNSGLAERVDFLGRVPDESLRRLYQETWVNLQPSSAEGWGLTVLEAAACGTPTVAFRNTVFPEAVGPACTKYLARDGDSALSDASETSRLPQDFCSTNRSSMQGSSAGIQLPGAGRRC